MTENMGRLAIVAGGRNFGESDRIINFVTAEGRLSAFAHGARKSRRRFRGVFENFATVLLEFEPRQRAGMNTIRAGSVVTSRLELRADLEKIALASYLVELCSAVAPEDDPADELFLILEKTLDHLCETRASTVIRRTFELKLIEALGYSPRLDRCVHCETDLSAICYLDFVRGGAFCETHAEQAIKVGPKTLVWLASICEVPVAKSAWDAAADDEGNVRMSDDWVQTAALKLSPVTARFFAHLIGRPLKSVELLQTVAI